jgi:hypothetical protein
MALISTALLLPNNSLAAWTAFGPSAMTVGFALAPSSPSTLFVTAVGPSAGIYKSTNAGASWGAAVNPGINQRGIVVRADNDQIVLAGNVNLMPSVTGSVVKSTDGGASFGGGTTGGINHADWRFSFASTGPFVWAAGLNNTFPTLTGRLLKSTNGGSSWTPNTINSDPDPQVFSVAVDPGNSSVVYAGIKPNPFDPGDDDGLYKTEDAGASWTRLTGLDLDQVQALAVDPADSQLVYAADPFNGGRIWRSTDGGGSWQKIHDPLDPGGVALFGSIRSIAVNPANSSVIYAAGGGNNSNPKVIRSTDCGQTWSNVTASGLPNGAQLTQVTINPAGTRIYVLAAIGTFEVYEDSATNVGTGMCPAGTSGGGPAATISVGPITADDVVNATEAGGSIFVMGSVTGDATTGDTVSLEVNGNTYTGTVGAGKTFSISVPGSDLAADTTLDATVDGVDGGSNPFSATTTSTHTVDTVASATISVNPITADDDVDAAEASGSISVTGSVTGDATTGDSVSLEVNGNTYTGAVTAGKVFNISVPGSDLATDTTINASVVGNDVAGNPFSATTISSHTVGAGNTAPTTTTNTSLSSGGSSGGAFSPFMLLIILLSIARRQFARKK